jgi:virulence-associated protein VapD
MYAILFDFDLNSLQTLHPQGANHAVMDIRSVLETEFHFTRQQDVLYFGDHSVNAVTCVLATQTLAERFDWFKPSVKSIRLLRIDENADLMRSIIS